MNEYAREYARIESRARRRGSFLLTYAPWIVLIAAGSIFGRVWNQTQAVRLIDELAGLKREERELLREREEHARSLVRLTTRERIAQVARDGLGMEYPAEDEIVFLPVAGGREVPPPAGPRRLDRPDEGILDFVRERLRGIVSQEAYALERM